jgi:predicted kinase
MKASLCCWTILIVGLPGVGKTTLAMRLSKLLGAPAVVTELVRSKLFDLGPVAEDIDFTKTELQTTYRTVEMLVGHLLAVGANVIIDGVFRTQEQRQIIQQLAVANSSEFLGIHVVCSEEVTLERLERRKQAGTLSPAGPKTYRRLKSQFEPVDSSYLLISTG